MLGRKRLAILMAEFLGTGVLALVVLSVQHSTIGLPYFVAVAAGLTIALLMVMFGHISGAHLNPAITIGLWTTRQIKTVPALAYLVVQMLGAWAAYYLFIYFTKTPLQSLGGHYDSHVLVAEAAGAFVFAMGWAALLFNRFLNAKAAATAGAAFFMAVVIASTASLGIVNPAIALSDRAFAFWGAAGWTTYALGPVLGAVIGFNLYALLFAPEKSLLSMTAAVSDRLSKASAAPASAAVAEEKAAALKPASKKRTSRTRKK